tara:strand:+ start:285 stop:1280 length:996 start_codon:yes stop_codon:yes gene_type:complete
MSSWDNYYQEFQSKLLRDRRLILSLKDNEESKKLLNNLGYKFDPEVENIDNCKIGGYYLSTANIYLNYDDENDTEIDVIDIHHSITLEWVIKYEKNDAEWIFPLVEKWFGIKKEYIADTGIMDGMPDLDFLSLDKSMKYPEYVANYLPLSHFECLIEESTKKYKENLAEHEKEPNQPQEVENSEILFFNENFIEILVYFYETFGEETFFLEEIAFGRGYSVNEVKKCCNWHYRDRFRFREEKLNNKLLEETRHELSTKLWPEGETAANWWANKAQDKNNDKNFLKFTENMLKFHLKEIRGSCILDCLKDLPLEEKARIIREAKETCEWFIK